MTEEDTHEQPQPQESTQEATQTQPIPIQQDIPSTPPDKVEPTVSTVSTESESEKRRKYLREKQAKYRAKKKLEKESQPQPTEQVVEQPKVDTPIASDFVIDTDIPEQPAPKSDAPSIESKPPSQAMFDEKGMKLLLNTIFDGVAQARGQHWKLSADESKTIVPPATRVANKYAPKVLTQYMDEITLAIAAFTIIYGKIQIDIAHIEASKVTAPVIQQEQPPVIVTPEPPLQKVDNNTIKRMYGL